MVGRKKNLLDAFQASALEGRAVKERKNVQASAGGPFAPSSPRAKAAEGGTGLAARALRDPIVRGALALALVAIVGAYWLGTRRGGDEVEAASAAGPSGPGMLVSPSARDAGAPPSGETLARLNQQRGQAGTPQDQRFLDKANQFTIRLVQYNNDEAGLRQAKATFEYLRGQGLPAVAPISIGKGVIVCVDSAPRKSDLDQMLGYVRKMQGPDEKTKRPPFADAYVVNIDDVLER